MKIAISFNEYFVKIIFSFYKFMIGALLVACT